MVKGLQRFREYFGEHPVRPLGLHSTILTPTYTRLTEDGYGRSPAAAQTSSRRI